uniref:Secreted protein n=1 Tax=Pyxicephalus adspersus TaxID=30357 RepID=A0AAV2ZWE4_PYXAD|nr:TPA: hypothetical protein GDO54_016941 [Pyxicephalus adspersus]
MKLQPAGSQVLVVLLLNAALLIVQCGHLFLQLVNPLLLLLQELLLGLNNFIELFEVFSCPAWTFCRALHGGSPFLRWYLWQHGWGYRRCHGITPRSVSAGNSCHPAISPVRGCVR